MDDHSLMPNVLAGEIGPKVHGGMAALDNGCTSFPPLVFSHRLTAGVGGRFNHVKIPLDQMLSRFSQVSPEGKYTKPPHDKLSYGGMIFIRAQMIGNLGWQLAKGAFRSLLARAFSRADGCTLQLLPSRHVTCTFVDSLPTPS